MGSDWWRLRSTGPPWGPARFADPGARRPGRLIREADPGAPAAPIGLDRLPPRSQDGRVSARKKASPRRSSKTPRRAAGGGRSRARPARKGAGTDERAEKPAGSERAATPDGSFLVVGIGGSAGALPALRDLLGRLPTDGGMAFVVLTHQAPRTPSLLPEILAKCTEMAVRELADGTRIEPDRVYVAPPGRYVAIQNGVLRLEQAVERGHPPLPIDSFFRSLARDREDLAVGIVLSGTGADGTLGLQAIRADSGLTLVQDPATAEFDGMPSSAIAAGVVDFALPTAQMPERLLAHAARVVSRPRLREAPEVVSAELERIVAGIRTRAGQDFSAYKRGTLLRRVERRMALHGTDRLGDYARFLEENEDEVGALWRDWLIGVTRFFRDPEVFEALAERGLSELLSAREPGSLFRIWVPACASGEEAYSIAMVVLETLERLRKHLDVQIFATDLDPAAIEIARAGRYPEGIAADVDDRRLRRFFLREERHYRVKKELRDLVVFAVQNVLDDPPFSRVDLISCRNLLIYLVPTAQQQLLPIFHYSLNPGGLLLLGASEGVTGFEESFSALDRRCRLFRREDSPAPSRARPWAGRLLAGGRRAARADAGPPRSKVDLADLLRKQLADRFAPPAVVVDERGQIQQIHGRIGAYLEPAPGRATLNVVEMARDGLRAPLASALREAMTDDAAAVTKTARVRKNGGWLSVDLAIRRIQDPRLGRPLLLVSFEASAGEPRRGRRDRAPGPPRGKAGHVAELEQELQHSRHALQSTIDELQASNEELASANEEVQSVNEELQSSNEELQTSKEETQSLNEELHTANAELAQKVQALEQARDDLLNLINSIEVATIFLDEHLRVKRFTPQAQRVVRLIDSDLGRPLADLALLIDDADLLADAEGVLASLQPVEKEVPAPDGSWYSVRIRPYRTARKAVEGLVLIFVDITQAKRAERTQVARLLAENIVDTVRQPLLVLDASLRVLRANRSFYQTFRVEADATEGRLIYDLAGGPWQSPRLRELLERVSSKAESFDALELEPDLPGTGRRRMLLNARRMATRTEEPTELILLAIDDVSEESGPPLASARVE